MIHEMHLNPLSFEKIKSGTKTAEIRLYDEKRKKVGKEDLIIFYKLPENLEILKVRVLEIKRFETLAQAYEILGPKKAGFEGMTVDQAVQNTRYTYSEDEEKKYGVAAIMIKVL